MQQDKDKTKGHLSICHIRQQNPIFNSGWISLESPVWKDLVNQVNRIECDSTAHLFFEVDGSKILINKEVLTGCYFYFGYK